MTVDKLRDWIADDGRLMTRGAERIILAMTDVMEAVEAFRNCKVSDKEEMQRTEDDLYKTHTAATSVIKEVTG